MPHADAQSPVASTGAAAPRRGRGLRSLLVVGFINICVLLALLVPVELIFGTWVRPMGLSDLKRFSIPIGTEFEFDTSSLYSGGPRNPIKYSRDQWGLRGSHRTLESIELLTVGGSTTEQRYLDDVATWQEIARAELGRKGHPMTIANAGVDGQSTVGNQFDFDSWFPLLPGLRPRFYLFYLGANDILRHERRKEFDDSMDATSWRVRSAMYQLLRTFKDNVRARTTRVAHGRMPPTSAADFTERGLLTAEEGTVAAAAITGGFLANVEVLRQRVVAVGATPVFMTQTAFGWNADRHPPRGLKSTITIHGRTVNYADVAFLHQDLNRRLLEYCAKTQVACFDLANDVVFDVDDYYDFLHNTPRGAEKIGRYLADRLAGLDVRAAAER